MNKLLEIFGRAITVDTSELIWHWLNAVHNNQNTELANADEFDQILDLMGNMELSQAQEKLKFYLFENEECILGRMAAAAICMHNNDLDNCLEQLQSVYLRQPSNTMALYSMGYCYERLGKIPEAVDFYQDCLKFKNHLQLPRQRIAAVYFKNGRLDKAILEYEILTTEHPEDISSFVLLGYLYIATNQFSKAIDTFNTAILAHPDNFHDEAPDDEVQQWIESEQFERALEHVQALIDQVGDMPDLNVRMADILSKAGRPGEAISYYENALRIQPNYLEATIKLGTHYLRFGKQELAATQFNRAMEINDEIVDAYIGLAVSQYLAEFIDESLTTLSLASAIQQNSTLLFSQTAMLHLQTTLNDQYSCEEENHEKGNLNNPQQMLEEVIHAHQIQMSATPKSPDIHYKYAILMMITNNLEEAIQAFERSLQINPTHHRARCKLSLCLFETGQRNLAIEKLIENDSLDTETLDLHYQTALLYCDKRKFAEALCTLENKMKENFTEPDAIVNIEVVLENLGLVDRVNTTWDRLTEAARNALETKYSQ